ncbi:anti-sigma factor domain-containing protein [Kitasatospora sp. NPDC056076]|uniref:anti-sigma factor n=1 Tax=Kitasatospora sp. NPDC056076 TaxID=3345703 RepID=UPI0035DCB7B0
MTTASGPDLHLLTGAYAAHALDPAENEAFERHLAACVPCALEVDGFAAALARLGAAQAVVAPPSLRPRVLALLEQTRQLPPRARTVAPSPAGRRRRSRGTRWPRFALAASTAIASTLGVLAYQQYDQASSARTQATQLREQQAVFGELLTASDARVSTTTATTLPGTGTVVWSPGHNQAGFLAAGLPQPASGRVYELWLDHDGAMSPAGLLAAGDGALVLSAPLDRARAVALTDEPAGGSLLPTTSPIMVLPLDASRTA